MASSSTYVRSYSESRTEQENINTDASLDEMLHQPSEPENFIKMAEKMAQQAQLVPALTSKLQQKEQEVRELGEILKKEQQEKDQLSREVEELKHKNQQAVTELGEILQKEKQEKDQLSREFEELQHKNLQSEEMEKLKKENGQLKTERDEYLNQIQVANERNHGLARKISDLEISIKDLTIMASSRGDRIEALQAENDRFSKDALERSKQRNNTDSGSSTVLNVEFSMQELQQATKNFSQSLKIGEGGFGPVYEGSLRQTMVAIKLLGNQSLQGREQFQQEVTVLSKMRHPNLVTLMGASSEASALVYEYLSNGSLEDRLTCANNTPPLTWQARTPIIGEICLALIFLHSNKPHLVVHGDLKPQNILLDTNLVSKLGDFGISRLLKQSDSNTTAFLETSPAGTFACIDPEYSATGVLTAKSDIYSFGIIILRILTGKPPSNIVVVVQNALTDGSLLSLIDRSARTWPFEQAKQLAKIALRCTELSRNKRPDLVKEVWPVVEPLMKGATTYVEPQGHEPVLGRESMPSRFICPIYQKVMQDPHLAADGFTYEKEAIRRWLANHNTSPMTNLPLPNRTLIPNHVLRSAIQEWLRRRYPSLQLLSLLLL